MRDKMRESIAAFFALGMFIVMCGVVMYATSKLAYSHGLLRCEVEHNIELKNLNQELKEFRK